MFKTGYERDCFLIYERGHIQHLKRQGEIKKMPNHLQWNVKRGPAEELSFQREWHMKEGDHIRVKNGTNDPDFKRRNLSGYTGVIEDIDDDDLVGILWDKATLSRFSFWFIRKCERRNLDHRRLFLSRDESEVIEPE